MSAGKSMVISRYESKYLVPEAKARAIRNFIMGFCTPDSHADANGRYVVNNFYFDTPDLRFYYDTKYKQYNRFKLRMRYYGDIPEELLWLEIKHKVQNVTWKTRRNCMVSDWDSIFECEDSLAQKSENVSLRDSFENAVIRFGAEPKVHVRYVREPYICDFEEYCRITFDRCLSFRSTDGSMNLVSNKPFLYYDDVVTSVFEDDDSPVILEIKTENQVPIWVMELIRTFQLRRRGFSKYCYAIDNSKERAGGGLRVNACL